MNTDTTNDLVQLVNSKGMNRGTLGKLEAHRAGELHLAFSVMLFRERDGEREYLLQKRASGKYHSGGLWTNACCSHPRPQEDLISAAKRRVFEELGVHINQTLKKHGHAIYRAALDNNMVEHEYDMILSAPMQHFTGRPNPNEVEIVRWWKASEIEAQFIRNDELFTAWFELVYQRVESELALASYQTDDAICE